MGNQKFVDELIREVIQPRVNELMSTRYFSELRDGRLSTKRLHRSHPSYSRYFRAGFLGVGPDIQYFRPYHEKQ
jgi:hypothetical protein